MSKVEAFLNKIGVEDLSVFEKEDFDVDAFSGEFIQSKLELLRATPDFVEPLKADFKKAGIGEAFLKAKKHLNKAFALGKSNSELEQLDYEDLLSLAHEASNKNKVADDVVKERDAIIANLQNTIEAKELEVKGIVSKYEGEKKKLKVDSYIDNLLSKQEYIVSKDKVKALLEADLMKNGISVELDGDNVSLKKGDYDFLLNNKKADLAAYCSVALDELVKKNNGVQSVVTTVKAAADNDAYNKLYGGKSLLEQV